MRVAAFCLTAWLAACATGLAAADDQTNDAALTPPQIEAKVLASLSAGRQAEAEEFLGSQLKHFPEGMRLAVLLSRRDLEAAKKLVDAEQEKLRASQRFFFLLAACTRSRFDVAAAYPLFYAVNVVGPYTPAGQCAAHVLTLDGSKMHQAGRKRINEEFATFAKLADDNPDDVMIRWMAAVECRTWNRNQEGAQHYKKILEKWNPGPVLVHQTYANLLDNLKQYQEALVERRKAVEMEPAGWSYDGLGNTLSHLKRYEESDKAHAMATKLAPEVAYHWTNWGVMLYDAKKYEAANEKFARAAQLDPQDARIWSAWGDRLALQGKTTEALEKLHKAIELQPHSLLLQMSIAALKLKEEEIKKKAEAQRQAQKERRDSAQKPNSSGR